MGVMLIVQMLVAIALAAIAAPGFWMMFQTNDLATVTRQNAANMDQIVLVLNDMARPAVVGGPIRPPAGQIVDGRYVLPEALTGLDRTPWGSRYAYCPAGSVQPTAEERTLAAATIQIPGRTGYSMSLVTSAAEPYLVPSGLSVSVTSQDGTTPDAGIIGYVLSPIANESTLPDCSDIVWREGTFVIDAPDGGAMGTVRPLRPESLAVSMAGVGRPATLYVSRTPQGRADGADAANGLDLSTALFRWTVDPDRNLVLSLEMGSHVLPEIGTITHGRGNGQLSIVGRPDGVAGAGRPILTRSGGTGDLSVDADLRLQGIDFAPGLGLRAEGGEVSAEDTHLSTLRVDAGSVRLADGVTVDRPNGHPRRAVEVTAGSLSVGSGTRIVDRQATAGVGAVVVVGGRATFEGDVVTEVAQGGLPYSVHGSGSVEVSARPDGTRPTASYDGIVVPMTGRSTVRSQVCDDPYACRAACPPLTRPASGGCSTSSAGTEGAILVGSGSRGRNWECQWSSEEVLRGTIESGYNYVRRPPPASPTATVECVPGQVDGTEGQ